MLVRLRNFLAGQPAIFTFLRKIIELNFKKQKRIIKETFNLKESRTVLDIGCGTGEFADLFKRLNYYGIDIFPRYLDYAAQKHHGRFAVMDAKKLKFPNHSFDYILIMAILHHLNDAEVKTVLAEAKRVLKPEGRLLIMEDAKIENLENIFIRLFQKLDKGEFFRTPAEYRRIISHCFNIDKTQSFRSGFFTYFSLVLNNK